MAFSGVALPAEGSWERIPLLRKNTSPSFSFPGTSRAGEKEGPISDEIIGGKRTYAGRRGGSATGGRIQKKYPQKKKFNSKDQKAHSPAGKKVRISFFEILMLKGTCLRRGVYVLAGCSSKGVSVSRGDGERKGATCLKWVKNLPQANRGTEKKPEAAKVLFVPLSQGFGAGGISLEKEGGSPSLNTIRERPYSSGSDHDRRGNLIGEEGRTP